MTMGTNHNSGRSQGCGTIKVGVSLHNNTKTKVGHIFSYQNYCNVGVIGLCYIMELDHIYCFRSVVVHIKYLFFIVYMTIYCISNDLCSSVLVLITV